MQKARQALLDMPHSNEAKWREVATNFWQTGDEYALIEEWVVDENIFLGQSDEIKKEDDRPKLFQSSFDLDITFENSMSVDNISDSDLYAIWSAQNIGDRE
jgi:hypothetical protein